MQALADDLVEDYVEHCRMHGNSWTDIGAHIGTEHLLWGLTAQDNSATRLLRAANVSPETVHRSVGTRLSMGASQAAERIAWTPYSRKAIAIAQTRSERNDSDRIDCDDLLIGLTPHLQTPEPIAVRRPLGPVVRVGMIQTTGPGRRTARARLPART
ncbi:hypothetical protein EJ357_21100 [Streptomyces cyaneochromogenes]|uniref:Clp R domain-containing protein n=2 Tax=Streptomyces cyaneochromogenes TaxID=2496836 RepID=A0A3S9MMX5_9ACTN|nr:hypothetical protein EJ357_21100 [Streptomyces cyaneochromogenes]